MNVLLIKEQNILKPKVVIEKVAESSYAPSTAVQFKEYLLSEEMRP